MNSTDLSDGLSCRYDTPRNSELVTSELNVIGAQVDNDTDYDVEITIATES